MRQQLPGTFRTVAGTTNAQDGGPSPSGLLTAARTSGCVIIDQVQLNPASNQRWSVLSLTLSAYLFLSTGGVAPCYGKLGKVFGGLVPSMPGPTQGSGGIPYVQKFSKVPADLSLIADMWNPAIDPLPPITTGGLTPDPTIYLPISAVILPPIPIALAPGDLLGAGMWITPSLLGSVSPSSAQTILVICGGRYVIDYDDGL